SRRAQCVCFLMTWRVAAPTPMALSVGWRSAQLSFLPCRFLFRAETLSAWCVAIPAAIPVMVGWRWMKDLLCGGASWARMIGESSAAERTPANSIAQMRRTDFGICFPPSLLSESFVVDTTRLDPGRVQRFGVCDGGSTSGEPTDLSCIPLWSSIGPPEPAERIGQDSAAMSVAVKAVAEDEVAVVSLIAQRRRHAQIGERPVAMLVVQVVLAVLQEDADRLVRRLADE